MSETVHAVETASQKIAQFVAGFDLADAPEEAIGLTETALIDTVGVMLAGSQEPAARIVSEMIAAEGADGRATVVGRALRTSAQNAALANGTATQALDFDLSYMIGQSAAPIIPGLLPLAETTGARAEEVISAFVVGCEVCGRLARAIPTLSSEGRWHGSGVLGALSAAAAFARLTALPADAVVNVIGISASLASGISENFGTMTKPLHPGNAARNGMVAAFLGARGFTASPTALDGPSGFLPLFGRGLGWDTQPFDDLGERFYLLDPGYKIKPFSCGGLLHTAIEVALELREAAEPRAGEIARITVGTTRHTLQRAIDRYPWSEDSSRFSFKYLIPHVILRGTPILDSFSDTAIDDDQLRALGERLEMVLDDEFAELSGSGYSPNRITIAFENGEEISHAVYHPSGSKEAPMGAARIKEKYLSCAGRVLDAEAAAALYDILGDFRNQGDLKGLWPMIGGSQ